MATQTGYKASELGEIPQDWDVVELGSVAEIQRGASPRPIDSPIWFSQSSNVGWLRISDVTKSEKYLYNTIQNLSEEGIKNSRYVAKDSLIMSICATVGKPIINRKDICIHDGFVVFRNPQFDIEFMFYVLQEYESKWGNQGQTGSQMNLNTDLIKNKIVCLPPFSEQTAIATALSDTDALISSLQTLIAKKKAIKLSAMQNLLSGKIRLPEFAQRPDGSPKTTHQTELGCVPEDWEVVELGEVANVEMCRRIFKNETQNVGDISFYKIGTFGGETDAYISRQLFEEYKSKYPYPKIGDILISAAGTIGRVIVFGGEEAYYQDSNIVWLNINKDKISNSFLYYFYQNTEWNSLEGSTIKRLYNSDLLSKKIALPPLPEQTAIAQLLSDMDAEIEALEGRLKKTQSLKQGMMQALLSGKIRLPLK